MAINKLSTIPKHLMINPAHPLPPIDPTASVLPQGSLTYPGSGGVGSGIITGSWTPPQDIDTIQGKMLAVEKRITHFESERIGMNLVPEQWEREIKKQMISMLVEEMYNQNCIEFTKQNDVATLDTIIRARLFVVPDDKVRIIRKYQK